jgi:predicted DNA-binding transcriptional regulator AlpA
MTSAARDVLTRAELLALPAAVDVATAARALGLGRSTAYELARRDAFPCRVLRVGSSYRIPTAELLRVLGLDPFLGESSAPKSAALSPQPAMKGASSR